MTHRTLCTTYAGVKQILLSHVETPNKTAYSHVAVPGFIHSSPNGKVVRIEDVL